MLSRWREQPRSLSGSSRTSLWFTRLGWFYWRSVRKLQQQQLVWLRVTLQNNLIVASTNLLCVCPQWVASPLNDMYADVVTTVVLEVQSNPTAQKCECNQDISPLRLVGSSSPTSWFYLFLFFLLLVVEGKRDALGSEVFAERLELMLQ